MISKYSCILLLMSGFISTNSCADTYACKDKSGHTSIQQFPCSGPEKIISAVKSVPQPTPVSSARSGTEPTNNSADATARNLGFNGMSGYEAARAACLNLLSRYDTLQPYARCSLNDQACLRKAGEESSQISARLAQESAWKSNKCDTVVGIESKIQQTDTIEVSHNDELFIINGEKFKAKTYCFRQEKGDKVKFIEGSRLGACTSAKWINLRSEVICSVWCE